MINHSVSNKKYPDTDIANILYSFYWQHIYCVPSTCLSHGWCRAVVTRSLMFCVVFCRSLFVLLFVFHSTIVLSVLLRFTYSDCPF